MPRVRPLTESAKIAARWQEQDGEFYEQFERIRKLAGMTKSSIAQALDISVPTLTKYIQCPDEMPKKVERKLVLLAERVGVAYDPALGGGKGKNLTAQLAGVMLAIDPETGFLKAVTA